MPAFLSGLGEMFAALSAAPEIYRPSRFWEDLNRVHIDQLVQAGFENFKRTVNTRYFNWRTLGIVRHQLVAVFLAWAKHPNPAVFSAQFSRPRQPGAGSAASFNRPAAWLYKTFVAMYTDVLGRRDPRGLLRRLEEPLLGNPFLVRHSGRGTSQDLCNSVHEFYSILGPDGEVPDGGRGVGIAELGAGYGRLAYVFLSALPLISYCIIDIPPALYLSQRYLTTLFPDTPVFRFRPFTSYADVSSEFEASRIRFLAAHQLELLPPRVFDYFVNISSLHEMTGVQVAHYFRLMDRVCRGRVYTKQWRVSRVTVNGHVFRESDYPIPATWTTIFHRQHPIQRMFFEALYEVG